MKWINNFNVEQKRIHTHAVHMVLNRDVSFMRKVITWYDRTPLYVTENLTPKESKRILTDRENI